jgi:hypothetical protein
MNTGQDDSATKVENIQKYISGFCSFVSLLFDREARFRISGPFSLCGYASFSVDKRIARTFYWSDGHMLRTNPEQTP